MSIYSPLKYAFELHHHQNPILKYLSSPSSTSLHSLTKPHSNDHLQVLQSFPAFFSAILFPTMACALQATLAANSCAFSSRRFFMKHQRANKRSNGLFTVRASSDDDDCNEEECAPEKEVGKISVEWLAGDRTKVVGTFPPKKQGWTGYVDKDTAGQTNIYSVEPAVYVAESAISSGSAGSSSDGSENTAAIAAGIALITVAAASSILLQVGKNPPVQVQTVEYSGPSLSYYISKFKPPELVQASVPSQLEAIPSLTIPSTEELPSVAQPEASSTTEVPQVQAQTSSENVVS